MLVRHLLEDTTDPYAKIWHGDVMRWLIEYLTGLKDTDHALLGDILRQGQERHPTANRLHAVLDSLLDLVDEHQHGSTVRENVTILLTRYVNQLLADNDEKTVARLHKAETINRLQRILPAETFVKLKLLGNKASRTKEQVKFDKDNQLYVFVGRPAFKEVPEGSGNYKKTLEIERFMPLDRHDASAHQLTMMMKLRARSQGEGSEVYKIDLPKGFIEDPDHLQPHELEIINQHKVLVR